MGRVEKINSLNYNRVRVSYVNRQRTSAFVQRNVAVEPVLPVRNQTAFSNENHLIAYDIFYRNLKKMEKNHSAFLGDKEAFYSEVNKEKEKKKNNPNSALYKGIKSLINKYNSTIEALIHIDKNYISEDLSEIRFLLEKNKGSLENFGIIINDLFLEIDGGVFWGNFHKSKNPAEDLFRPLNRLIVSLYVKFRNILLKNKLTYTSYPEDYKGTIINHSL